MNLIFSYHKRREFGEVKLGRGPREGMAHQSAFVGPELAYVGPKLASVGPESACVGPESASLGPKLAFLGPKSASAQLAFVVLCWSLSRPVIFLMV